MQTVEVAGFIGPTNVQPTRKVDAERTVNKFVEHVGVGAPRVPGSLRPVPTLAPWVICGTGPHRAALSINGRAFVVSGAWFYEVLGSRSVVPYGPLALDGNPASMDTNGTAGNQVMITSGGLGYIFDLTTNTLTQITDPSFPDTVLQVRFFDGFFIILTPSGSMFLSDLEDGSSWNALNFFAQNQASDITIAMSKTHDNLWAYGAQTTIPFYNSGQPISPFVPIQGALIEHGILAPWSAVEIDNTTYWLSQDEHGRFGVASGQGYTPIKISNPAIDFKLSQSQRLSEAIGFGYQLGANLFYLLYVPDLDTTIVYNIATKLFHEIGIWNPTLLRYVPWPPRTHMVAFGQHLFGDRQSGALYAMSETQGTDYIVGDLSTAGSGTILSFDSGADPAPTPSGSDFQIGSIMVGADTVGLTFNDGVIIDGTTGAFIATASGQVSSELGAVMADGHFALKKKIGNLYLYTAASADVGNAQFFSDWSSGFLVCVCSDTTTWYYASASSTAGVKRCNRSAVIDGSISWTLTLDSGATHLGSLAVDTNNTTFFYTSRKGALNLPIRRWDVVNNVALTNLVAGIGVTCTPGQEMICLPGSNNDLICMIQTDGLSGHQWEARRYGTTGSHIGELLGTYALGSFGADGNLAIDLGDPTAFWVRMFPDDESKTSSTFFRFTTASTTPTVTFTVVNKPDGSVPQTCPFFAWSAPPTTGLQSTPPFGPAPYYTTDFGKVSTSAVTPYVNRWLRRFPHIATDNKRVFISRLEILAEPGLSTDDLLMIRASKDGGYTWSVERDVSSGAAGRYLTRVQTYRWGQARDWVFEVSGSGPVPQSLLAAWADLEAGTN